MKNQNNTSYYFYKIVQEKTNKGWGLGRIFNHMRKMNAFIYMSDLGILRSILFDLKKLRKLPSKEKIKHHFRTKVPKDDYCKENKGEVLKDLYKLT